MREGRRTFKTRCCDKGALSGGEKGEGWRDALRVWEHPDGG